MRVSVFGLGYVGCVTAACLARSGHQVIGVDVDHLKVDSINRGSAPFYEPGLGDLVSAGVSAGRLRAVLNEAEAVRESELALLCVGTPSNGDGSVKLDHLKSVFQSIGRQLRDRSTYFVVVLRSTVMPHLLDAELLPLLEAAAGKPIGPGVGFVCNPEFLREGSAIEDFYESPLTLIGQTEARAGDLVARLYAEVAGPVVRTDPRTALLVKYASNAFHALKVVFANEMGSVARELGVDGAEVMEIVCQDTKLNISRRYLAPGFAFGGSCLRKDLRALMTEAQRRNLKLPILDSVLLSNELHLRNCIRLITALGRKKIGLVGLTFKAGTDDVRESQAVELAESLIAKGYELRIFEASISPGSIHGSNLRFLEHSIPHVWKLLTHDFEQLLRESDVVVLTEKLTPEMREALKRFRSDQICVDLVRAINPEDLPAGEYRSLSIEAPAAASPIATVA